MSATVTRAAAEAPVEPRRGLVPPAAGTLLAAQIAGQVLAVVMVVLLARRLGVDGFGVYAFAAAVAFVANVVTTFGTDMVLIREIAAARRLDLVPAALALQLLLSVGAIALIAAASLLATGSGRADAGPVRVFALSLVPAALFSVATAVLRGLGRMRAYAAMVMLAAAVPLGAVLLATGRHASAMRVMVVLLGAQIAIALIAWAGCATSLARAELRWRLHRGDVVSMARTSRTIGGLGMVGVLYQRTALLGVAFLSGPAATAWYSSAGRLVEATKTGHVALGSAVYPLMAADDEKNAAQLRTARRLCLGGGAAIAATLLALGPWVVDRVYGAGFAPARHAVLILAAGVVPSTWATFVSLELFARRQERVVLRATLVSFVVLLAAAGAFVVAFGWIGAAWAMLLADVTLAIQLTIGRPVRLVVHQ